jgi:ASCH domain
MPRSSQREPATFHLDPGQEYHVLSLHPEWAWAVLYGGKNVENRTWETQHRGPLLIHASLPKCSAAELAWRRGYIAERSGVAQGAQPQEFTSSAILGMVDLMDCVLHADSPWAAADHVHWLLSNPRVLEEPLLGVGGKLKVWRWRAPESTSRSTTSVPSAKSRQAAAEATSPGARIALDDMDPASVLAAFRAVVSSTPQNDVDVYRAVSRKLGFARMGSRVEEGLRAHARSAVRKGALIRVGKTLRAAS